MIKELVKKNRSYRRFYQEKKLTKQQLMELVEIARLTPSAANRQPFKYRIVCDEEENEKVAFLKLKNVVIENYENKAAKMESGAIDHVAIDVKDIEKVYELINQADLNTTRDIIHFLPFWENGVRFFTIEGPNKEKIEFSQYL